MKNMSFILQKNPYGILANPVPSEDVIPQVSSSENRIQNKTKQFIFPYKL